MEDNEPIIGEPEEGGETSNRMFIILAAGLGGLLVIGVCLIFAFYFFVQRPQQAAQQAAATAQIAANATAIAQATLEAIPTDTPAPTDTPEPSETPQPTATNTPVVALSPTPSETPLPTVPVTPGKPTATPTKTRVPANTPRATLSGAGAGSAEATPTVEAGSTPATGIGGFGPVLVAGALVIALFAARGLRLAQRRR